MKAKLTALLVIALSVSAAVDAETTSVRHFAGEAELTPIYIDR